MAPLAERADLAVKDSLKQMTGDSLCTLLSHFLFKYHLMPQAIIACTLAEMLMGHRPKSRLDLLPPDMKAKVKRKQDMQ